MVWKMMMLRRARMITAALTLLREAINAYLDAHRDEVEEHHRRLEIKPPYHRKAEPIGQMITIAEEPMAFPWGKPVMEKPSDAS